MAIWHVAPLRFAPAFRALGVCEHCHCPLAVWIVIADEWGSEGAMDAACDSPHGISFTNLKTLNPNLEKTVTGNTKTYI